ncbi:MAG: cytochrome b/b6 domain-containing protein [Paracoccaceae bacterium]
MNEIKVWDIGVRLFHWSLVIGFTLNAMILRGDSRWHEWVGYAILGLLAFRLVWGFVGTPQARFSAFPPSISGAVEHLSEILNGEQSRHLSHNPLGALMVYNLMVTLALTGVTGWMMTTDAFWGVGWVQELHGLLANWAILSVVLHVGGVVLESRRGKENLVRAMLTGYKRDG